MGRPFIVSLPNLGDLTFKTFTSLIGNTRGDIVVLDLTMDRKVIY